MKFSELKRKLKKQGCYKQREGGNHEIWFSPITGALFAVGRHDSQEVAKPTLRAIQKQSGIKL